MYRNILLAALAAATLAGCASGYSYRNGNGGDYYYGEPRTEYRYYGPHGYYGGYGYGGVVPGYYYDRYGRLVYGSPYGYYGYPYGHGGQWWQRPRPWHDDHHADGDGHDGDEGDRSGRKPPWRDVGGLLPRDRRVMPEGEELRPRARREQTPSRLPAMRVPQREQRSSSMPMPRARGDVSGGARAGSSRRNPKASPASDE